MTSERKNILLIEVNEPVFERGTKWLRIRNFNVRSVATINLPGAEELGEAALNVALGSVFPSAKEVGHAILERIRGPLPGTEGMKS